MIACVASPTAVAWVATSYKTRDDVMTGDWLIANLAWNEGRGGLSFDEMPPSKDPAGHGSDRSGAPADPEEFVSAPLAFPIYLNASLHIRVDVYLQQASAPGIDCGLGVNRRGISKVWVELYVDDRWVGGGHDEVQIWSPAEPHPPGFLACRYRFPSETSYLPQGSVLRLKFVYTTEAGPYRYGTGDGHWSRLSLPVFSPEDAFYRLPQFVAKPSSAEVGGDDGTGASTALASLSFLSMVPSLGRPRTRRLAMVTFLAFAVSASACLNPATSPSSTDRGPSGPTGSASVSFVDPGQTGLANQTSGSIIGQIHDPYQMPVRRAYVGLLETSYSTISNDYGIFSFKGLKPGTYRLRIDRQDYETLETNAAVRSGAVTKVDIVLAYETTLEAGKRPHLHDYWSGSKTFVLFDGPLYSACSTDDCQGIDGFYIPPKPGVRNLVLPGTVDIEVNLTWDPATTGYRRVGLVVQANNEPDTFNWSFYMPRGPGEPFHVAATWETTDVGHQLFSTWVFGAFVLLPDAVTQDPLISFTNQLLRYGQPGFQMITKAKMTLHRGALPLEAPHPDHWGGKNSIHVEPGKTAANPTILSFRYLCSPTPRPVLHLEGPSRIVPAGTERLILNALQERPSGVAGSGLAGFGWELWYHDGASAPTNYIAGSPSWTQAPDPTVTDQAKNWTFTIPITDSQTDGLYAKKTAWRFALVPDDPNLFCLDYDSNYDSPPSVHWSLVATRPSPS